MRPQQFGADFVADFRDVGIRFELGDFENQFARQGIAVGVQAAGRQREKHVAGTDRAGSRRILRSTAPTMKPARSYSPGG